MFINMQEMKANPYVWIFNRARDELTFIGINGPRTNGKNVRKEGSCMVRNCL